MSSLQDLLDIKGKVLFPKGRITLPEPLLLGSNTHLNCHNDTTLITDYDGPAIKIISIDHQLNWSIKNLLLEGGGIQLPPQGTKWTAFYKIKNVRISRGGRANVIGIEDLGGNWQGRIKSVWCPSIIKRGGTTTYYSNCHVGGWNIQAAYAILLRSCSMDRTTAKGISSALFADCRGLSIDTFDFEHNHVEKGALMSFLRCDALNVKALWSVGNEAHVSNNGSVYLVLIDNCIGNFQASLGGGDRPTPDKSDGADKGHTVTLRIAGDKSRIHLSGSTIRPLRKTVQGQTAFGFVNWERNTTHSSNDIYGGINGGIPPGVKDPFLD